MDKCLVIHSETYNYLNFNTYPARPVCWSGWISDSYCSLKPLCSYLADPTSPIPSHCAVIILLQSVTVHQLL